MKRFKKGIGSVSTFVAVMTALDFRPKGLGTGTTLSGQLRASRLRMSMSLERAASRSGLSPETVASLGRRGGSVASLLCLMAVVAPGASRRAP